ncbi:CbtA family protein [Actinoplanes sp. TBRC 11911]|uniref:CbtA family protein n=1 Tax=Actinoplanes sp. TBRC 11911 TaxID=2729386 RepID=UPI00145E2ED3|nr:CbtA family protein [Actinoplanes sp. TBRC 11911]NMO50039.1 CbtA family protein [Actinoplanes sp. TBRC 11911]
MEKRIIWRGILAGAIGGLLAFVFARIFAEPQIQKAIDYEAGRDAAQHALDQAAGAPMDHHEGAEVFSRAVQGNFGIGVALIFFGAAMGALFAVAYALYLGRAGRVRPRTLALLVAGGGFVGMYLVPFVKYPANPPAVGNGDTISQRSSFYLLMVAASLLFLVLAVWLGKRLRPRFGTGNATLIAGGVFLAATAIVMLVLPSFGELAANKALHQATETPGPLTDASGNIAFPGFPADLLYNFRLYSIGAQLILWATIGLVFAPMAERLLAPSTKAALVGA